MVLTAYCSSPQCKESQSKHCCIMVRNKFVHHLTGIPQIIQIQTPTSTTNTKGSIKGTGAIRVWVGGTKGITGAQVHRAIRAIQAIKDIKAIPTIKDTQIIKDTQTIKAIKDTKAIRVTQTQTIKDTKVMKRIINFNILGKDPSYLKGNKSKDVAIMNSQELKENLVLLILRMLSGE